MADLDSLAEMPDEWFEKPLPELPEALRKHIQTELFPLSWENLAPEQRRRAVDCLRHANGTENADEHSPWWSHFATIKEVEQAIETWEKTLAETPSDLKIQEERLNELKNELSHLKQKSNSPEISPEEQRQSNPNSKNTQSESDEPLLFVAYPRGLQLLNIRFNATAEELAAWVFMGPENRGLAAYLSANELKQPGRFFYTWDDGSDFDYIAPLMACWFHKDDIENFQPADRYLTGEALIDRWNNQPGIEAEAYIRAKIAESRLIDLHPVKGLTQGTFPDDDHYPPLQTALFNCTQVESIEQEDFGPYHLPEESDDRRSGKRDQKIQLAANALAKQWLIEHKQFSKREIASALASSDEWKEMKAIRIERIIRKEW